MTESPRFRRSDAWLLLALGFAADRSAAPLFRVIAAGDAIQHAVYTWEEIDGGLFRLSKAGYAGLVDGAVVLTRSGRAVLAQLTKSNVIDRQEELWILLRHASGVHDVASARDDGQPAMIPQAEYRAAVEQYTRHPATAFDW